MNINEIEKLYREIENKSDQLIKKGETLENAVAAMLYDNFKNLSLNDISEFYEHLNTSFGNTIKFAYNNRLSPIADIDYQILKQSAAIKKQFENCAPKNFHNEKDEQKEQRKIKLSRKEKRAQKKEETLMNK